MPLFFYRIIQRECNKIVPLLQNESAMIRLIILLVLSLPVWAVDDKPPLPDPMLEVPDLPMPVENGEAMEPDITITRKGQENYPRVSPGWGGFI